MIASVAPASKIMRGETSPVCAPSASQWTSCALTRTFEPRAVAATAASAVKGGATTNSQWLASATSGFSRATKSMASPIVLYIFQFPAISGLLTFSVLC